MSLVSTILKPIAGAAALTAIAISIPTAAQAFSVSLGGTSVAGQGVFSAVPGATTVDFNGITAGTPTPFTSAGANYQSGANAGRVVVGTQDGSFRTPTGNTSNYFSVGGASERGPVSISFSNPLNYFGLYWGSIDRENSVAFFRGSTLIRGFGRTSGFTSIDSLFAGQGVAIGTSSRYVNFFADNSSEWFDRVVLSSSRAAFESDNHAFRVIPTPALVPAAIGFGAAMLRKRKKSEQEAAGDNA